MRIALDPWPAPELAVSRDAVGHLAGQPRRWFVIGGAMAFFLRLPNLGPAWRLLITTGFCGGLTTFSTFCAEVLSMLMHGRAGWAMATAHL
ncbi:CrcB family protein [Pseudomonas mosselii]